MAFSEIELKRHERAINAFLEKKRPPIHIRDELDIGYRIDGQSVEVLETRPDWRDDSIKMERPAAKATFVKNTGEWKVYWMRQDLKWHKYDPRPKVESLEEFLEVVDKDENCCFFG